MNDVVTPTAVAGQSRYGWLAAALRARILQGEWAPGDAIPPESALAPSYSVALGTMRQAIALLVDDGLLERRQGKGTFVKAGLGGASMLRFFRFRPVGELQAAPASRILSRKQRAATATDLLAFGLDAGARVLVLERLRSIDGQPCLLETLTLPLPLFEPLAELDTAGWDDLLYPMYQRLCGVVVHRAEDQLSFDVLNATQARRLRLDTGHACVRVRRRAYDIGGRCIELRSTLGDAFAFEYTAQVR
jgi:GntR family transcriptional regulator